MEISNTPPPISKRDVEGAVPYRRSVMLGDTIHLATPDTHPRKLKIHRFMRADMESSSTGDV